MKAIHNGIRFLTSFHLVVLYLKDTEKWKQFTTNQPFTLSCKMLCCISKIQKNESNSQLEFFSKRPQIRCVVSQRYRKMKAIHNTENDVLELGYVVLYLKDTEKWKQFTTILNISKTQKKLCCISKIQKNESNSQRFMFGFSCIFGCVVSQRYRKMKAIHNYFQYLLCLPLVVLYLKDTEKWKQFTTFPPSPSTISKLCCISKIQKNESNSQPVFWLP